MSNALFVYWNIPHEAFWVGTFPVRYYGLLFLLAFVFGTLIYYILSNHEQENLLEIPIILGVVFVSTIVGARLGECLFYQSQYFLQHPSEIFLPFAGEEYTGIVGLSGHGAALAIPLGLYFFARKKRISYLHLLDKIVISVALAAFFIRIGNLFNSEIQGVPTNLPWGFVFSQRGETFPRHPVQLYEALSYLLIFVILLYMYINYKYLTGIITSLFLILVYTARFFWEYLKAPLTTIDEYRALTTGQILSVPFIFIGCFLLIYVVLKTNLGNVSHYPK